MAVSGYVARCRQGTCRRRRRWLGRGLRLAHVSQTCQERPNHQQARSGREGRQLPHKPLPGTPEPRTRATRNGSTARRGVTISLAHPLLTHRKWALTRTLGQLAKGKAGKRKGSKGFTQSCGNVGLEGAIRLSTERATPCDICRRLPSITASRLFVAVERRSRGTTR
ncbi:hypothetical protein EDB89DRAFT_595290 [Lactarius sanguifluus]|nr:hypothetical protein EDB89DRAFT_595290 [Lactarius sanguifluus]